MNRPHGMHEKAWKMYLQACFDAGVSPDRVTQTIGNARASKGYHARDGFFTVDGHTHAYCAAVDIRTRDLNQQQIHLLLERLAECGFAAWWRRGRMWRGNNHIHAVYAGVAMKYQLRQQVDEWLAGGDGLKGNLIDRFVVPSNRAKERVRHLLKNPDD